MFLFLELNVNQKNPQNKIFFKLNGRRKLPFAHFKDKEPSLVHLLDWTDCFWKQFKYNKVIFKLKQDRQVYKMEM